MSVIQEADHLKAAVAKIDERLLANERERAQLVDAKRALQDLIGEPAAPHASRLAKEARPAASRQQPSASPARETDKAATVDTAVLNVIAKHPRCTAGLIDAKLGSRISRYHLKLSFERLAKSKRIVVSGTRAGTRYSVPGAQPAPAADAEGD